MKDLCILATGGTIDKDHDPIVEDLVFDEFSHVPDMLSEYRVADIPHEVIMLIDSLDMTEEHRKTVKDSILERSEKFIVVTHGTSTMTETAEYLKEHITDKVVVLTGAMRPFSLFRSDGGFNLGSAIAAARLLEPGIYIAMNGQIFEAGKVAKDESRGVFVSK